MDLKCIPGRIIYIFAFLAAILFIERYISSITELNEKDIKSYENVFVYCVVGERAANLFVEPDDEYKSETHIPEDSPLCQKHLQMRQYKDVRMFSLHNEIISLKLNGLQVIDYAYGYDKYMQRSILGIAFSVFLSIFGFFFTEYYVKKGSKFHGWAYRDIARYLLKR